MKTQIEQAKALGEETRLRIFRILAMTGERLCVCELEAIIAKPQYAVSRALGVLRKAGLVDEMRDGRLFKYGLRAETEYARHLAEAAASIPCSAIASFSGDLTATEKTLESRIGGKPDSWCGCMG